MPDTPSAQPPDHEPIPLARDADAAPARPAPAPREGLAAKPLLDLQDDSCPNCGAAMAADAVVCMRCGFDQKAGVVRRPEVGVVEVAPPKVEPEFVTPGRLSPQALAATGVGITILAMIGAGVTAWPLGTAVVVASVVMTLYHTLLHACTGVVAVGIAARLAEERFTRIDLAAARMFVAYALFQLVVSLMIPGVHVFVSKGALAIVGAGAYFLALMILFKKDHTRAGMIALVHLALYAAVRIAAWLSLWLESASRSSPGAGA